ncbi:45636_t:CDS:2 [Gigaspora margarita]|uniref:45636_t:CDS:1 n=1 Tax=Gigaspora margarita TaxID=4874 RepID=A0ABN7URL7_GIGMA|nr:45636_t:CDS:2 [Gigaspora margarita]
MQQNDLTQNTKNIKEQVKEIKIDVAHTIMGQRKMDMDEISNTTVEGTKILHQSYSSVVTNKNQILASMELVDSTGWPEIVRLQIIKARKALREIEIDTDI